MVGGVVVEDVVVATGAVVAVSTGWLGVQLCANTHPRLATCATVRLMFWFVFHLKVAYSTELGASTAYRGHAAATADPDVAAQIRQILDDELHHRKTLGDLLTEFDAVPYTFLEWLFWCVGNVISVGCHLWGEWASAFGAAQFEFGGAGDYVRAAKAARAVGREDLAVLLDEFQAQETAHRAFFLALARSRFPGVKRVAGPISTEA